jgi:ankyrin repeat protein
MKGNLEIARILLEAGAERQTRRLNGNATALDLARGRGHVEIVSLLE